MKFPYLFRKEVENEYIRDNFTRLMDYFTKSPVERCGFSFIEIVVTAAVTNLDYPHGLGFQPKDIIVMSVSNNATLTLKYDNFTDSTIRITTSAATTVRTLIGRFS